MGASVAVCVQEKGRGVAARRWLWFCRERGECSGVGEPSRGVARGGCREKGSQVGSLAGSFFC